MADGWTGEEQRAEQRWCGVLVACAALALALAGVACLGIANAPLPAASVNIAARDAKVTAALREARDARAVRGQASSYRKRPVPWPPPAQLPALLDLRAPDKWRAANHAGSGAAVCPPLASPAARARNCTARAPPRARGGAAGELSERALQLLLDEGQQERPAAPAVRAKLARCLAFVVKHRTLRLGPRLDAFGRAPPARPPDGPGAAPGWPGGERLLSCAVVGSSDILRLHGAASGGRFGAQIDAHDVVIRINHAPTAGFESSVGSRTSYRLVNHVLLDSWLLPPEARRAELATDLCSSAQRDAEGGCLYKDRGLARLRVLASYAQRLGARSRIAPIGSAMSRLEDACGRALPRQPMSGGFLGILLALQARCALPVHVYGFYPFCCHAQPFPAMRYKYYHAANESSWVCCAAGREAMEEEYAIFEQLEALGWLRLHAMLPLSAIGAKCSAVPRGDAPPERAAAFEERSHTATRLADFDCGALSIERSPCSCRVCVATAARACLALNGRCVGYEVSRGSPHIATLKGRLGEFVSRPGVTLYALRGASDGGGFREAGNATVSQHDLPCAPGERSLLPTAPTNSCVVCPGVAAEACERTAGCSGYTVNREGSFATLKAGAPLPLSSARGATAFVRERRGVG